MLGSRLEIIALSFLGLSLPLSWDRVTMSCRYLRMCEVWCRGSVQVGSRLEAVEKEVRAARNSSSYLRAIPRL